MIALARLLLSAGAALMLAGAAVWMAGRHGGGRIPGDIVIRRPRATYYIPLGTGIIVSVVLSILATLLARVSRR